MKYILKCDDYYLSDINYLFDEFGKIIIIDYQIGKEFKKVISNFEVASEIRKEIFIETGLSLEIKRFKKGE